MAAPTPSRLPHPRSGLPTPQPKPPDQARRLSPTAAAAAAHRVSPPSSRSTSAASRPPSSTGSTSDRLKMPPPPPRTRSASIRSVSSASTAATNATTKTAKSALGKSKKEGSSSSPVKSVLGRVRRAVGGGGGSDDKDKEKKSETSRSFGRTMSLRSSSRDLKDGDKDDGKKKEKEKKSMLGRTMSLRSSTKLAEKAEKAEKASEKASEKAAKKSGLRSVSSISSMKPDATAATTGSASSRSSKISVIAGRNRPASYAEPPAAGRKTASPPGTIRGHQKTNSQSGNNATAAAVPPQKSKGRPAFTTLQHSPDPPKPAPPATVSPRSRAMLSPPPPDKEIQHKQAQLLQLSCMYSTSHATYSSLRASANASLSGRFTKLSAQHATLRTQQAQQKRRGDFAGLAAVVEAPGSGVNDERARRKTLRSPEEKIQSFSESLKRLETVQGGEHRACARRFGDWIAGYAPPATSSSTSTRSRWVDGLGKAWQADCASVARRIEVGIRGVETVVAAVVRKGEAEAGVVGRLAEGWLELAKGMLEEIEVMAKVEREVVERERRVLAEAAADIKPAPEAQGRRPVWAC